MAQATEPVDFGGATILDQVDAVTPAQEQQIQQAIDQLRADTGITLHVAYVDTFTGEASQAAWGQATNDANGFGDADALLAVAVQGRQISFGAPSELSTSARDQLLENGITPELQDGDWAGAAVTAAEGIQTQVQSGTGTETGTGVTPSPGNDSGIDFGLVLLYVLGAILLAAAVTTLVGRRRKQKAVAAKRQAVLEEMRTAEQRAGSMLVQLDDALETSEQEVGFAEAEFGSGAVGPYREVLASAGGKVREAFALKQKLDDTIEDTDEERRTWAARIVDLCQEARAELDAQAESFEELRALEKNAPQTLAAIVTDAESLQSRIDRTQEAVDLLGRRYAGPSMTTVTGNVDQARSLLSFATDTAQEAAEAIRAGGASTGEIAVKVRAAQQAVGQAGKLLDGVDRVSSDLEHASTRVQEEIADVRSDIQDARAAQRGGRMPELTRLVEAAEQAIADAKPLQGRLADPLTSVTLLQEAEARLDEALAPVREQQEQVRRAIGYLPRALSTAESQVATARDFISTRRGGVGEEARTRLAHAQRALDDAHEAAPRDPVRAVAASQAATSYSAQAIEAAQRDLEQGGGYGGGMMGGRGGGDAFGGAIMGGIIGGLLSGGGGGGWGGGGGGGFSGGGFGGGGGFSGGGFGGGGGFSGGDF
ncbi:TPM domain-containing protein [Clavibacter michiganensis]|nr:TPM domain-containing protein [Clavibacter michiganensis]